MCDGILSELKYFLKCYETKLHNLTCFFFLNRNKIIALFSVIFGKVYCLYYQLSESVYDENICGILKAFEGQGLRARLCCRNISDSIFWLHCFTPR